MRKFIAVTCFAVAALGFSATSAFAANNVSVKESAGTSTEVLKNKALAINNILSEKNVINSSEWFNNLHKIATAATEAELQSIYDELFYKIMTSPL